MAKITRDSDKPRSLSNIDEKCVGCGICSELCPTNSIQLGAIVPIARGLIDMDKIKIDHNTCSLCGLCSSVCPFDALEFEINSTNAKDLPEYPQWTHDAEINEEICIFCNKCKKACPAEAIYISRDLPDVKDLVRGEAEIDQEKCIKCGICEEMCPSKAIEMDRNVINSSKPEIAESVEIDESKCIYCGICKKICPEDAIKIVCTTCMNHEEIETPEIKGDIYLDKDACIKCGWCQEICPVDAAEVTKPFEGEITHKKEDFTCKGETCHACMDVCPCNAVSIVDGKSVISPEFCILCGACTKACPQQGIIIKRDKINLDNVRSTAWQKKLSHLTG